jgi:hypothetical protein
MEVFMLRKLIVTSTLGLFLATSVVTPASAATIKTGTACKKAGQVVKVGKKTYVCGKNPIVTPTKNTYMLTTCSKANALYRDGMEQYEQLQGLYSLLDTADKAEVDLFKKNSDDLYANMKSKLCKRGA